MSKSLVIDERLDSYKSFFDHDWAKKIMADVGDTPLADVVFDLSLAWRCAANTQVMPWLMAVQLKQFYSGMMQSDEPMSFQIIDAALAMMTPETFEGVPDAALQRMRGTLRDASFRVRSSRREIVGEFDPKTAWAEFLKSTEFRFSVWGSQRLVYGAVYFGYEDFLVRVFKILTRRMQYRMKKDFPHELAANVGDSLCDDCWLHRDIDTARLVRNALTHNGGRVTPQLKNRNHGLRVENSELHIMPPDTRALFDLLKVRALNLAAFAADKLRGGSTA